MKNFYSKNKIINIINEKYRCKNGRINTYLIKWFKSGKFNKLYKSLWYYTNFLSNNSGITERFYCIINDIKKILKCKKLICNNFVKWHRIKGKYKIYCSKSCCIECTAKSRNIGKIRSEETKEKIRQANLGKKQSKETIEKRVIKLKGQKRSIRSIEWCEKISKSNKGKKHSKETKRKMRLTAIKRIEENNGKVFPHFNKNSIFYFKNFDKENNTKGLYGKNEYQIKKLGYWLDYINFNLKLIIEWDEENHFKNNKLKLKDIQRQKEIENYYPTFKFIRIREKFMELNYV